MARQVPAIGLGLRGAEYLRRTKCLLQLDALFVPRNGQRAAHVPREPLLMPLNLLGCAQLVAVEIGSSDPRALCSRI